MSKYCVVIFVFSEPMREGLGAFAHPDGGSAALHVGHWAEFVDPEEALAEGVRLETLMDRYQHSVVVEEVRS